MEKFLKSTLKKKKKNLTINKNMQNLTRSQLRTVIKAKDVLK